MKFKQILISLAELIGFSFLLNFFWESLHGYSLYQDHIIDSDKYVRMMIYMSFMDAVTILAMYLVCAFFMRDILWLKSLYMKRLVTFFVIGFIVASVAEYWAVYISHEWHYNNKMPMVFGIGLSPLIQLSVTGLTSLWVVSRLNIE